MRRANGTESDIHTVFVLLILISFMDRKISVDIIRGTGYFLGHFHISELMISVLKTITCVDELIKDFQFIVT